MTPLSEPRPALGARAPDVEAVLPLLPVLATQVRETREQVEQAVVSVCANFNGMAARARQGVEQATALVHGDEGDGGVDGLITSSHATLENLLQRIVKGGELSMKAVYRMDDVEEGMKRISAILADVNDVATRTRLLTVNAKIEAARVGEQGKGFAVVAGEISQLSVKSAEIVVSITDIINKLSADVAATVSDLRELASADMSEVLLGKERIEQAVVSFEERHRQMHRRVSEITRASQALADEVSGAVVGLQFQDRVSQRLEHVVEGIESVERTLRTGAPAPGSSGARALLTNHSSRYTMPEERDAALNERRAANPASASKDPAGDIVLF